MTATTIGLRYGLGLAAALIVYGVIFRLLDLDPLSIWTQLFYLAQALVCLGAQWVYRNAHDETAFLRRLGTGTLVSALGAAGYGVYVFLYNRFIDDSLLATVAEIQREQLRSRGLSGEELTTAVAQVEQFMTPGIFAAFVAVRLFLTGLAAAALGALIFCRWRSGSSYSPATNTALETD